MKIKLAALTVFLSIAIVRADDTIASVQQTLKDQGFYYGEISGQKSSDTTAAIRRYQIRNGLQITGELNDETLRSLRSGTAPSAQATAPAPPAPSTAPAVPPANNDANEPQEEAGPRTQTLRPPVQYPGVPPESEGPPLSRGTVIPSSGGLFAGTPFESAPPEVQRRVIVDAQKTLARRGLFKNEIDGFYGPNLEFSLRAYQSKVGLPTTGRLDLETLAALELLPGAHMPMAIPRRSIRPPMEEPPVRGEWIRP